MNTVKIHVLCDNHTYIDQYYYAEPAFSVLIEDGERTILFDTAYSDVVNRNAERMGIDLTSIDTIVLSHGHNDHTRGLISLFSANDMRDVDLICGPNTFETKHLLRKDGFDETFGSPFTEEEMKERVHLITSAEPMKLSEHVYYSGHIGFTTSFEKPYHIGQTKIEDRWEDDYMEEEGALYIVGEDSFFTISGCSHRGICNIIEKGKDLFPGKSIHGVLGGFHLFKEDERLNSTIAYFKENNIKELYPCHCTSFRCRAKMHQEIPLHEVGVGMKISIPVGGEQ